jgi:two-component system cell cycle sensor histidine kinase/response regulator CckA
MARDTGAYVTPDCLNILTVEGDGTDGDGAARPLTFEADLPCRVTRATSMADACTRLASATVDLVIVDVGERSDTAVESLRRLTVVAPMAAVIVVAEVVGDAVRRALLNENAYEVLTRSESTPRQLSRSVRHLLEHARDRHDQQDFEKVLETIPDAILIVGKSGHVRYVNRGALMLFDRQRSDFVGELLGFSIADDVASELTIVRRGSLRLCEIRVVPIAWRDESALLASLRDVTDQRRMEAQLVVSDRMVSMGTLAAGVAHEINNPLASVMANLDLALEEVEQLAPHTTATGSELLDELLDARDAAERVRLIVRDLKAFSRPESGDLGPVDLHRAIETTVRMVWNEIRHRARLVKDYGVIPPVLANEPRLGQVLLNLLVNAAQAIPEGRLRENEIRISTATDERGRVTVTVADTGTGMTTEVQKQVFTTFFTTKPVGKGTGLGLAISKRIMSAFGGDLTFESEVGKGTRFVVTLEAATAEPMLVEGTHVLATTTKQRARVLAVDDEKSVTDVLKRTLSREHDVTVANSAAVAMKLLTDGHEFDVFLCDLHMPQGTGMELYADAVAFDPAVASRFIFMTGGAFTPSTHAFIERTGAPVLEKPFDVLNVRVLVRSRVR